MAPKALESQLVISGHDKTGAMFAAIGQKFDRLFGAAKRMDTVGRDFLNVGSAVDRVGTKLDTLHGKMRRIETAGQRLGKFFGVGGLGSFGLGLTAAYGIERTLVDVTRATAQGQHERARMETAGMTPDEIGEAEAAAAGLSAKYPALSQTTLLHMLRNARSIVGSYEEAAKVMDPLAKLRIVALGAHPDRAEELEGDFDQLVKGMEIKGVTQNLPKFTHYINGMAKALNVFGDTLRPTDYYQMFKYGNVAVQALSDRFMLETAPTFAQEMGGSRTGTSLAMFYAKTVGDAMTLVAANELKKFGLIDMTKVQSKAGRITKLQPGAVADWRLAGSDPYAWINQVFLPALARHGVTDKATILGEIATIFGSGRQSSGALVSILATQQSRIEKDRRMVEHAQGLAAGDTFMNKDVLIAWRGVTEQLTNLMQVAGSPLALPAAHNLNAISAAIADFAGVLRTGAPKNASKIETAEWYGKTFMKGVDLIRPALSLLSGPAGWASYGAAELTKYGLDNIWGAPKTGAKDLQSIGAMPGWMEGMISPEQWHDAVAAPPAVAELKGDATVTVKLEAPDWLQMEIEQSGHIGGLTVRGTTGSPGKAWDDVGPGR